MIFRWFLLQKLIFIFWCECTVNKEFWYEDELFHSFSVKVFLKEHLQMKFASFFTTVCSKGSR